MVPEGFGASLDTAVVPEEPGDTPLLSALVGWAVDKGSAPLGVSLY